MPSHRVHVGLSAVVGIFLLMTSYVWAVEVHLAWDAPTTADGTPPQGLAGYKLYYGQTSQLYDVVIDVGNRTTYTLSGLQAGRQYYFSVVAYDEALNESPVSEELSVMTPGAPGSEARDSDGDDLLEADEGALDSTDALGAETDEERLNEADDVSERYDDAEPEDAGEEGEQPSDADTTSTPPPPDPAWTSYGATVKLHPGAAGAVGIMFRYQDPDNYYRFSWHSDGAYGRLIKCYNGAFTLLAQSPIPHGPPGPYRVDIVADGPTLEVSIQGTRLMAAVDADLSAGGIGLYTWWTAEGAFADVIVRDIETQAVLAQDDFTDGDLRRWVIVEEGTLMGPSDWSVADGALVQRSEIYSELTEPADLAHYGTYALYTK
jgi:hypothetical protein